jgi:hypothetical protein
VSRTGRHGARAGARGACARALAFGVGLAVVGVAGLGATAGCGGAQRPPSAVDPDDAIVTLSVEVPEATLWVNGRYVGQVGRLRGGIALSAGAHRLEIRHDDFVTHYEEITVRARERRALVVHLAPVLP